MYVGWHWLNPQWEWENILINCGSRLPLIAGKVSGVLIPNSLKMLNEPKNSVNCFQMLFLKEAKL